HDWSALMPAAGSARRKTAKKVTAAPADGLYPALRPYRKSMLRVSPLHELYFEESGNPQGKPVVFLHGGPGGGTNPQMRRFFDPRRYRIVLYDQRGCGKSTPHASLEQNTTWDLVEDTEKLRIHLGIDRWQVFGGSWGSTLALAYAQHHPERVSELVLRGIFLLRRSELEWFYQSSEGAASLFPDLWEQFIAPIPEEERYDMMRAYYRRLTSTVEADRNGAARAWSQWEGATSHLRTDPRYVAKFGDAEYAAAFARIECHYFVNGGFLDSDDQLLRDVPRIRDIPAVIVQGRYDVVCPMRSAWDLHRAWPEAELVVVPDAGHSAFEPGIARALRRATDRFARRRRRA
ncbi:MAG TPA: prolyl aminopeptidase, partial [Steroidobacteraceae bacterium]|nr:prolyl aminopeptidase [Steroidobacteraceae bacterium]